MKIGLVPMAAKPYHAGHSDLVSLAAAENDIVYLFVSTSDRCRKGQIPIYGKDMKDIWCNEIENILPENVTVDYGGSPVRKVIMTLSEAEEMLNQSGKQKNVYSVYSDPTDTYKNYLTKHRKKSGKEASVAETYFPNLYKSCYVIFPGHTRPECFERGVGTVDISGTEMRKRLGAGDREGFISGLPNDLEPAAKNRIFNKLFSRINKNESVESILTSVENFLYESSSKSNDDLILGTENYNSIVDKIILDINKVKKSLGYRKKTGKFYRKEASKLQDALNALRYLRRKNQRILDNNAINEKLVRYAINENDIDEKDLSRDDIKNFIRRIK